MGAQQSREEAAQAGCGADIFSGMCCEKQGENGEDAGKKRLLVQPGPLKSMSCTHHYHIAPPDPDHSHFTKRKQEDSSNRWRDALNCCPGVGGAHGTAHRHSPLSSTHSRPCCPSLQVTSSNPSSRSNKSRDPSDKREGIADPARAEGKTAK